MSEDTKSIHEFDLSLIVKYYAGLKRQGPGSPEITRKALSFITDPGPQGRIADLGCGSGGQTMVLAQNCSARVTGIDLFPEFIDLFNKNTVAHGLKDRVSGEVGSMDKLRFEKGSLDVIWSEGAIYNIGFEEGLKLWHSYLKKGGYVAVSEASWFTGERPVEIQEFWESEYPGIETIPAKLQQMQDAGYLPLACFTLPENCWTEHFYEPQVAYQESFLEEHKDNRAMVEFIKSQQHESRLYYKFKEYYGYAFFIGQKL